MQWIQPRMTCATALHAGDGSNDLSMIKLAGIGIAMGNAAPDVMLAADAVVGTNDEDGAADEAFSANVQAEPFVRAYKALDCNIHAVCSGVAEAISKYVLREQGGGSNGHKPRL